MANEMPARPPGRLRNFHLRLLNLVFTKKNLAGFDGFLHDLRRMRLAHRKQRDRCRITPGPSASGGDALLN